MKNKQFGFTLMEILIALFIFTILTFILMTGLRTVINSQAGTENKAERLRNLQMALLVLSRDVEQAVNRPIVNSTGKEEVAFVGKPQGFELTHTGFANPVGSLSKSTLQRTQYALNEHALVRITWPVLDQAPGNKPHYRRLLEGVMEANFQYLDQEGRFRDVWPLGNDAKQPLPRAVRVELNMAQWGKISQLYLIPVQESKNTQGPNPGQQKKERQKKKPTKDE